MKKVITHRSNKKPFPIAKSASHSTGAKKGPEHMTSGPMSKKKAK